MNLFPKQLVLLILVMFSSIFVVFGEDDVCCYVGPSVEYRSSSSLCEQQGGVTLGPVQSAAGNQGICSQYDEERSSLKFVNSNTCTNTVGGNIVYNIPEVLDFLREETDYSEEVFELISYDATCGSDPNPDDIGDEDPGDTIPGENEGENTPPGGDPPEEIGSDRYDGLQSTCASLGGGFMGFFNEKNVCENVVYNEQSSENPCIYNPYGGGKFSSKLHYSFEDSLRNFEEPACIPKLDIRKCGDYKTQNNCQNNVAYNNSEDILFSSSSSNLKNGCSWVPKEEYASSLDNQATGICISKSIDEETNFDVNQYTNRLNIINNPSFRENLQSWETNGNIITRAFDDEQAVNLESGDVLEQSIKKLAPFQNTYIPKFYIKQFTSEETPQIEIKEIFEDGSMNVISPQVIINPKAKAGGPYKEIIFEQVQISGDAKSINFSIIANSNISVDLISLQSTQGDTTSTTVRDLFIPVELIPEEASYCSECFNPLSLNSCTQEKSDSLGACSYMVSGPDEKYQSELNDYTGKEENVDHNKWKSQSLSNSQIFCESYVTQETCENESNAVNEKYSSLHTLSKENQLCKWDSSIGCFKDSNNDNLPDVINGMIKTSNLTASQEVNYDISNYRFENNNDGTISDFEAVCDSIPPLTYLYLNAKNQDGERITIEENSYDELIGNVSVVIDTKDYFPLNHACSNYSDGDSQTQGDVDPQTNLIFSSGDKSPLYEIDQFSKNQKQIDEIFSDELSEENFEMNVEVVDQSGNLGLNKSVELDSLDLKSPGINSRITSLNEDNEIVGGFTTKSGTFFPTKYITKDSMLYFDIQDKGGVSSCSYNFDVDNSQSIQGNSSTKTVEFDDESSVTLSINVSNYIFDVPDTGGDITMNLECVDVFGQKTTHKYLYSIAGDMFIESPAPFPLDITNYNGSDLIGITQGIYNNQNQDVVAYLSRNDVEMCSVNGEPLNIQRGDFSPSGIDQGEFSVKLTGEYAFSQEGNSQKELELVCGIEESDSQIKGSFFYFYDNEAPIMNNFELLDNGNSTYYDNQDDTWYTINEPRDTKIQTLLDGTGSWMNISYDMYAGNRLLTDESNPIYQRITYQGYEGGHNFVSPAIIPEIPLSTLGGDAVNAISEFVLQYDLLLEIQDKAGNKNNESIDFIYDNSTPKIEFTGDIITQNDDTNKLYTSVEDPTLRLNFNALEYRTFTCLVEFKLNNQQPIIRQYENIATNETSFKLSNIFQQSINVSRDNVFITPDCSDETYDDAKKPLNTNKEYQFSFDDTPPKLTDVYLEGGNSRYFQNKQGSVIESIVDNLIFEFNDTGEEGYTCNYDVNSLDDKYLCNNEVFMQEFTSENTRGVIEEFKLLLGYSLENGGENQQNQEFKCYQRTNSFWNDYHSSRINEQEMKTTLSINAQCSDYVGLESKEVNTQINITYTNSKIDSVEFNYSRGFAKPIVSMINLPSQQENMHYVFEKQNGEELFNSKAESINDLGELKEITFGDSGIDTSNLIGDELELTLNVYSGNSLYDSEDVTLYLDKIAPNASMNILDNIDGEVDSQEFKIDFSATDEGSSNLDEVKLYVENSAGRTLLYSKENGANQESYYTQKPLIKKNLDKEFEGNYFFQARNSGEHTFYLEVADGSGNQDSENITLDVVNNAILTLLDTQTAKVSSDPYELITRNTGDEDSIDIAMGISPQSTCRIYPYKENNLTGIEGAQEYHTFPEDSEIQFDISNIFPQFSMNKAEDNTIVLHIECENNGETYHFNRELTLFEGLPDYTLSSTNGFYFNSKDRSDYVTTIEINSVGPINQIQCQYSIQGNTFNTTSGSQFSRDYEFILDQSTNNELTLQCRDSFGVEGPQKSYNFVVSDQRTQIGDVSLYTDELSQKITQESESIYVAPNKTYSLEFNTNKQGASCRYEINNGGVLDYLTQTISSLLGFTFSTSIDESNTPYLYRVEPLAEFEDDSTLTIECESARKEVDINIVEDSSVDVSLN